MFSTTLICRANLPVYVLLWIWYERHGAVPAGISLAVANPIYRCTLWTERLPCVSAPGYQYQGRLFNE